MKEKRGKAVAGLVAGLTVEHATAFEQVLARLKRAAAANSDMELAEKLGLKRSSISAAKTRGAIPPSWVVNTANLFKVSADWIIFGDEHFSEKAPKEGQPSLDSQVAVEKKNTNDYTKMAKELALDLTLAEFEELWDRFRSEKEWRRGWLQVEIINRFPEFLEWLKDQPEPVKTPSPAALMEPAFIPRPPHTGDHRD